jgi:reactive intermediate/imine deaminase
MTMRRVHAVVALVLGALAAPACRSAPGAGALVHHGADASGRFDATRPFTDVVRAGELLFVSGKLGTDSAGKVVPGGIGPETRQAMTNIRASLERVGSSMDRIAKCTVFLVDTGEWGAMNQVYVTFFPGPRPARTAVGVKELLFGARVEIECVALAR